MIGRLRAVEWTGDWDNTIAHVMSRRVPMREYLRRASLWAQAYSAESAWPFFDVTTYLDPRFALPSDTEADLGELLGRLPWDYEVKRTCAGAVRMAGLKAENPAAGADLPELYEPLVLFYERGGEFLRDHAGFVDLIGVLMRPGTLRGHLGTAFLDTLDNTMLDAMDAAGRITYYTAVADQESTLLRRRVMQGTQHNEVFSREDLRWKPTGPLPSSADKAADHGLLWLDEMKAASFIAAAVSSRG